MLRAARRLMPPALRRLLLGAALSLAGCALGTPPPGSGIATPDRFLMPTGPEAAPPDALWWRRFAIPELDALIEAAMIGNQDIAVAVARLNQADAALRAAGAALLPEIDASGSATRARNTNRSLGASGQGFNRFQPSLSASYVVDLWGGNRANVEANRASAAASAFNIGVVTLSTQAAVANTYFTVLGAAARLAIQRENLAAAQAILGILRDRAAAGTATGLDVAQQEVVVAQQRAAAPPLLQSLEQSSFALATLAGSTPQRLAAGPPIAAIRIPAVGAGLPSDVLLRRPDIRLAEQNLAAATYDVTAARAALFPRLTLTASGGVQSLLLENLLRPGSVLYSAAAGLTQPIFDGGRLRAQLDQARAQREEFLATYRRAILNAFQDTESALSALARTSESVTLQAEREAAARRAFTIADAQFRAGTIDLLTVLNTQTILFSARDSLAQAQTQRLQAAASLFTALGGGWTPAPEIAR